MSTPIHYFWLLSQDDPRIPKVAPAADLASQWEALRQHSTRLELSDDLIQYFADSFQWVPTINPVSSNTGPGVGLNLFGPTLIDATGARPFARILAAWIALFREAPSHVMLRGLWTSRIRANGRTTSGQYARIVVPRDQLLTVLHTLEHYAQRTCTERTVILHMGL